MLAPLCPAFETEDATATSIPDSEETLMPFAVMVVSAPVKALVSEVVIAPAKVKLTGVFLAVAVDVAVTKFEVVESTCT
ncbi:hypothetical protein BMF77_pb00032 (plasmid) [Dolichospermum sp. UHCC 0315A]|nr:hypothetical protein BMF77_04915 [Dolichospermum sp. UHCC 0315A]QEI44430.1 hypothetical protein BMF77_pb00032 [Dolichospermum sp. UHCC 0315A]